MAGIVPANMNEDENFNDVVKRYDEVLKEKCINLWAIDNMVPIIIEDEKSTMRYSNQTNGHACYHPEIVGYLVPVGFKGVILEKFMNFGDEGSGWELDESFYNDIPEILKQLNDYFFRTCIHEIET